MPTPFLSITLHEIQSKKVAENDWWPGNTAIELYQTWQMYELRTIEGTETATWGRQGFSTRGGLRGYTRFHDKSLRTVIDPQITLAINTDTLPANGDFRRIELRVHHWEQNDGESTQRVRSLFSDPSMQVLVNAWVAAEANEEKARNTLNSWVSSNWQTLAARLIEAAAPAAAGVVSTLNLLPLLGLVVDVARHQADRYFSEDRIIIGIRKDNENRVIWKVDGPGLAPGAEIAGTGMCEAKTTIRDADNSNVLDALYRVRLI